MMFPCWLVVYSDTDVTAHCICYIVVVYCIVLTQVFCYLLLLLLLLFVNYSAVVLLVLLPDDNCYCLLYSTMITEPVAEHVYSTPYHCYSIAQVTVALRQVCYHDSRAWTGPRCPFDVYALFVLVLEHLLVCDVVDDYGVLYLMPDCLTLTVPEGLLLPAVTDIVIVTGDVPWYMVLVVCYWLLLIPVFVGWHCRHYYFTDNGIPVLTLPVLHDDLLLRYCGIDSITIVNNILLVCCCDWNAIRWRIIYQPIVKVFHYFSRCVISLYCWYICRFIHLIDVMITWPTLLLPINSDRQLIDNINHFIIPSRYCCSVHRFCSPAFALFILSVIDVPVPRWRCPVIRFPTGETYLFH